MIHENNYLIAVSLLVIGALLNAIFGQFLFPTARKVFGKRIKFLVSINTIDELVIASLINRFSDQHERVYLHDLQYSEEIDIYKQGESIRSLIDQISDKSYRIARKNLKNAVQNHSRYFDGTLINRSDKLYTINIRFEEAGCLIQGDYPTWYEKHQETEIKLKPNETGLALKFLPNEGTLYSTDKFENYLTISLDDTQIKQSNHVHFSDRLELYLYRGFFLGIMLTMSIATVMSTKKSRAEENAPAITNLEPTPIDPAHP